MNLLDPDRILALSYIPAARRPSVDALWRLDAKLGAVGSREPMISRIKLAWWREALERLDHAPPPAEPLLQSLAEHVLPRGISGAELAAMEEGWAVLVGEADPNPKALQLHAEARGAALFRLTARLLGVDASEKQLRAGQCWALADLARRNGKSVKRHMVEPSQWPVPLRPLGMLAILAFRDAGRATLERQGSPSRMLRMLTMRLTGR